MNTNNEICAFDYVTQRWCSGEVARVLLIQQARENVELLEGSRGAEFARMICSNGSTREQLLIGWRDALARALAIPAAAATGAR